MELTFEGLLDWSHSDLLAYARDLGLEVFEDLGKRDLAEAILDAAAEIEVE